MISLIIKGGLHAAVQAAQERGIRLATMAQHVPGKETLAGASDEQLKAVVTWYLEDRQCEVGVGYPAGTLLHYSARQ